MVNRIVADGEPEAGCLAVARRMAEKPAGALRAVNALVRRSHPDIAGAIRDGRSADRSKRAIGHGQARNLRPSGYEPDSVSPPPDDSHVIQVHVVLKLAIAVDSGLLTHGVGPADETTC